MRDIVCVTSIMFHATPVVGHYLHGTLCPPTFEDDVRTIELHRHKRSKIGYPSVSKAQRKAKRKPTMLFCPNGSPTFGGAEFLSRSKLGDPQNWWLPIEIPFKTQMKWGTILDTKALSTL